MDFKLNVIFLVIVALSSIIFADITKILVNRKKLRCDDPPNKKGNCARALSIWVFNKTEYECQFVTYGGCQFTKNKFDSKSDCEEICMDDRC